MPDVINEISKKRLGMTCVVTPDGRLAGIVTDGDLRRHMTTRSNLLERRAADVMTTRPVTIGPGLMAVEALRIMEERKITSLVVVGPGGDAVGVVHLHDLWQTEMI
jgi:arabinose-5-phosphate isomerase